MKRSFVLLLAVLFSALVGACEEGVENTGADIAAIETGVGGGGAPAAAAEPEAPAPKQARRFLLVEGTVTVDEQPAAVDAAIGETAKIVTGDDGRAVITLEPGSAIEIRKGTALAIGTSERKRSSVRLLAGALFSLLPGGASYEVETDNAIAGVRGTAFYVEAQDKAKSYICACDGAVTIESKSKKGVKKEPKSDNGHLAFMITTKGKKDKAKKAKRMNHTDEEGAALGALAKTTVQESEPVDKAEPVEPAEPKE